MAQQRCKDYNWTVPYKESANGNTSLDAVSVAVLLDLRDELKALNRVLYCPNTARIPKLLAQISRNTKRQPSLRRRAVRRWFVVVSAIQAAFAKKQRTRGRRRG